MQHEAAAADAARLRFDERQHRDHRYGRIGRGAALMQNLAPRLGRARIGRRGYALRGGERREGEGDERGEREESFQHGRDIGENGRASCRASVWRYVYLSVVAGSLKKKTNKKPHSKR